MSMRIGITMRVTENASYPERRDSVSQEWGAYIAKVLPEAVLVPLLNRPDDVIRCMEELNIEGVILSGGNDWDEAAERDETEKRLVDHCMREEIAVLGVCRGMEVLNVLFGGQLEDDIYKASEEGHVNVNHTVKIQRCRFANWDEGEILTNSFHSQGIIVSGMSDEFKVFAQTALGVVEGFYHPNKPVVGIQWHPERDNPAEAFDKQLIRTLFYSGVFSGSERNEQR
ncbi:MAG: hypothetical protein FVQ85_04015 [Planctomycetes bacterium]|nr:hypothetical protein [Planctomycetota bacterium]